MDDDEKHLVVVWRRRERLLQREQLVNLQVRAVRELLLGAGSHARTVCRAALWAFVHGLCTTSYCLSPLSTGTHKLGVLKRGPSLLGVVHERACRFYFAAGGAERRIPRLRKNRSRVFGATAHRQWLGARAGRVYSGRDCGYERTY